MGIKHRSGLLALFACAAVLCHFGAASSDMPVASKWTGGFRTQSLDRLPAQSSLEANATDAAVAAQQKAGAMLIVSPSALKKGDIISLLRTPLTSWAAPYVFGGSDMKLKGILDLKVPSACKFILAYKLEQFSLALSRDNTLVYACEGSDGFTNWAQTNLTSNKVTAESLGLAGLKDRLRARSIAVANDGTTWAMANNKYLGEDYTFMLNFDDSLSLLDSSILVSPVMTAMGLDGPNHWFEFANGRLIQPLDDDHDNPRTFGIAMAVFPNGTDCTAVLPMPDGTTIVGCAGPGNNTDRICAYQIKGGKATGRRQILHQWCVPPKAAERDLPSYVDRSAEINLALSADRSSFYLNYNDYYQKVFDSNTVFNKHPKWFKISLSGPSMWEQIANRTLFGNTVGAAVVVGAIPVSQVSRHSREQVYWFCSQLGQLYYTV
jgi:predicted CxxxxCH...CXXCH cytochrome family protein